MQITIKKNERRARFEALAEDGTVAGFADYEAGRDAITFPHTVTEKEFGGQGIASKIAQAALEDARALGMKVVPKCPFFAGYIERNPEFADLAA